MNYIYGSAKDFFAFINSIEKNQKVSLISHNDLDGIACAILLNEALKQKKLKKVKIYFTHCGEGMFKEVAKKIKRRKDGKVITTDISVEADLTAFEEFRKEFDCFVLDHHPSNISGENILKTKSEDCTTLALYELLKNEFDLTKWRWLVLATCIAEFSHLDPTNLKLIQGDYPNVTLENIWTSTPAITANKICSTLVYFRKREKKVFSMLQKQNLTLFDKYYNIIEKAISEYRISFKKEAEFYPDKNIYFFYKNPKYRISSFAVNRMALEEPEKIFIVLTDASEKPGFISISLRNQSGKEDVNLLVRKAVNGFENANGGGHQRASGGKIMKKDLEKFKENILKP